MNREQTTKGNEMKEGDKLYTGAIATKQFAETYNLLSADIEAKERLGFNVEALKNGRHNMFVSFALANKG